MRWKIMRSESTENTWYSDFMFLKCFAFLMFFFFHPPYLNWNQKRCTTNMSRCSMFWLWLVIIARQTHIHTLCPYSFCGLFLDRNIQTVNIFPSHSKLYMNSSIRCNNKSCFFAFLYAFRNLSFDWIMDELVSYDAFIETNDKRVCFFDQFFLAVDYTHLVFDKVVKLF